MSISLFECYKNNIGLPTHLNDLTIFKNESSNITFVFFKGETEGTIITRREGETYYGNNYNCKWLIDAGEGKRIKLTILSMDLEWVPTYTTCSQYDNVKIIEGRYEFVLTKKTPKNNCPLG